MPWYWLALRGATKSSLTGQKQNGESAWTSFFVIFFHNSKGSGVYKPLIIVAYKQILCFPPPPLLSPGYLHFLGAIHGEIETLKSLPPTLPVSSSPANSITGFQLTPTPSLGSEDKTDLGVLTNSNLKNQLDRLEISPGQPNSEESTSGCNIS